MSAKKAGPWRTVTSLFQYLTSKARMSERRIAELEDRLARLDGDANARGCIIKAVRRENTFLSKIGARDCRVSMEQVSRNDN